MSGSAQLQPYPRPRLLHTPPSPPFPSTAPPRSSPPHSPAPAQHPLPRHWILLQHRSAKRSRTKGLYSVLFSLTKAFVRPSIQTGRTTVWPNGAQKGGHRGPKRAGAREWGGDGGRGKHRERAGAREWGGAREGGRDREGRRRESGVPKEEPVPKEGALGRCQRVRRRRGQGGVLGRGGDGAAPERGGGEETRRGGGEKMGG